MTERLGPPLQPASSGFESPSRLQRARGVQGSMSDRQSEGPGSNPGGRSTSRTAVRAARTRSSKPERRVRLSRGAQHGWLAEPGNLRRWRRGSVEHGELGRPATHPRGNREPTRASEALMATRPFRTRESGVQFLAEALWYHRRCRVEERFLTGLITRPRWFESSPCYNVSGAVVALASPPGTAKWVKGPELRRGPRWARQALLATRRTCTPERSVRDRRRAPFQGGRSV